MALHAPQVFSQSANFEGFSVQAGSGYESVTHKYSSVLFGGANVGLSANQPNPKGVPVFVGLGYTAAVNEKFTLGGLVEYNFRKSSSDRVLIYANGAQLGSGNFVATGKQIQLSLVPAYAIDKTTLAYGKLSYLRVSSEDGSGNDNPTLKGYGVGAGVRHFYNANIYAYGEASYMKFNASSIASVGIPGVTYNLDGNGYNLLVGVGYKF